MIKDEHQMEAIKVFDATMHYHQRDTDLALRRAFDVLEQYYDLKDGSIDDDLKGLLNKLQSNAYNKSRASDIDPMERQFYAGQAAGLQLALSLIS